MIINYNWKGNLMVFAPGPLYGETLSLSLAILILIDLDQIKVKGNYS